MVRIHAEPVGPDKALVKRQELGKLIEVARKVEEVELLERLAVEGGSLQFLEAAGEDIYTENDLKVRYW